MYHTLPSLCRRIPFVKRRTTLFLAPNPRISAVCRQTPARTPFTGVLIIPPCGVGFVAGSHRPAGSRVAIQFQVAALLRNRSPVAGSLSSSSSPIACCASCNTPSKPLTTSRAIYNRVCRRRLRRCRDPRQHASPMPSGGGRRWSQKAMATLGVRCTVERQPAAVSGLNNPRIGVT